MGIDVAVAPSVRTPGAAIKVNLLAGASSPGTGALKVLLIAAKSSSGTITAQTEVKKAVAGPDAVSTFLGPGVPGHLASKAIFKEYGLAQVDLVAPTAPVGVAATLNLTFASTPTVAQTFELYIAGRKTEMLWAASETAAAFALRVIDAINAKSGDLPTVASNGGSGICTITFKIGGTLGNDCRVRCYLKGGSGGTVNAGSTVETTLSTGTTVHDPTAVLALVNTTEYAFILLCEGNTEVNTSGANTGYARIQTHIDGLDTGLNAKLQQQVIGFTGTAANATTAAGYRNFGPCQLVEAQDYESLPCELAGAELGQRLREISADPKKNRIRMPYVAKLYGPKDPTASKLSEAQVESGLNNGWTPIDHDEGGTTFFPIRPITTYFKDTLNNPDDRLLDVSRIDGTYAVARDLRSAIPQQFAGLSLSKDLPPGSDPLPPGVVEEKTVKTFAINRVRFWADRRGVVQKAPLEEAIANGEFICQVDASDSSQLDLVVPVKIVPPLAKFSIVVNHVGP